MWRVHTDGLKELVLIITVEGRLTNEHLIEEDPEGPPVHGEGVLQALQDLEGNSSLRQGTSTNWGRNGEGQG